MCYTGGMKRKSAGPLVQVMFRLSPEHVEALDALSRALSTEESTPKTRVDAVRWLINKYTRNTGRR